MLPPVFYVQQLEQNLLRKLFSPPTPANPTASLFARAARLYPYSIFSFAFFARFFVSSHVPLVSCVCAARRSHLHQYSVFVSPFHFRPRPFGSAFVIFCFLVFPFFFDPYFRRFYDFFLRRKYPESLVGVIRRFGVRPRATRAKKFPA